MVCAGRIPHEGWPRLPERISERRRLPPEGEARAHFSFTIENGANEARTAEPQRSRAHNNRKGQSPLTRSFESTGPDVKIRGTPAHIAEKYMTLARDATTSGDPVLAENYLQHAEHYNRIIMAFREQNVGPNGEQMNGGMNRDPSLDPTDQGDDFDDDGDDGDMQQPSMAPMRQSSISLSRAWTTSASTITAAAMTAPRRKRRSAALSRSQRPQ